MASLLRAIVVVVALAALWPLTAYPDAGFDPTLPCLLKFGRGSGMHGLDTVRVLHDGTVVLHCLIDRFDGDDGYSAWQTATLKLSEQAVAGVLDAIERYRLFDLEEAYHGNVFDGEQ